MEEQKDLPKPQTDLPLPERDLPLPENLLPAGRQEIPSHSAPALQGEALEGYGRKFPFPKYVFTTVVFVILLAIIGGAYYLGRNSVFKELNPSNPVPPPAAPVIQASPTPNLYAEGTRSATANWKTYTNTVLGYEIKYPKDINIEKLNERDILVTRLGVPYGGQEGKVAAGGMSILSRGKEGLDKGIDLRISNPPFQETPTTINGFQAIKFKSTLTGPYAIDYFITDSNNERTVRVSIGTSGDKGYEESTFKTFNQILSTFQFTE